MEKIDKIPLEFLTIANQALLALGGGNFADKSFKDLLDKLLIPAYAGRERRIYSFS